MSPVKSRKFARAIPKGRGVNRRTWGKKYNRQRGGKKREGVPIYRGRPGTTWSTRQGGHQEKKKTIKARYNKKAKNFPFFGGEQKRFCVSLLRIFSMGRGRWRSEKLEKKRNWGSGVISSRKATRFASQGDRKSADGMGQG